MYLLQKQDPSGWCSVLGLWNVMWIWNLCQNTNVLFGIFNAGEDFVIVNHLILVAQFYIYRRKLNGVKPTMLVLKTKIRAIHNIEGRIAFMRNKVEFYDKNGKKSMLSSFSLFPASLCLLFYLYISVVEYTYWFIFQDKVKYSSFYVKLKHQYQIESLIKSFLLLKK